MAARDGLAVEPLLQIVERRHLAAAHHQQLAVEHDAGRQRLRPHRERRRRYRRRCARRGAARRLDVPPARGCRPTSIPPRSPSGSIAAELPVLDLMRQHQRAEGRHRSDVGRSALRRRARRTARHKAGEARARPPRSRRAALSTIRRAPVLASRAETPTRSAPVTSLSSAQRSVASSPSSQCGQEARHLASAWRASALARSRQAAACRPTPRLLARSARWSRRCRRHSRARARTAPDRCAASIISRKDAAERQPEEQPVGQRGERPAAVGIRRRGEIIGEQTQFVVARRRIGEPVQEFRESLHDSSSSRPISASALAVAPRGLDVMQERVLAAVRDPHLLARRSRQLSASARANRHGRRSRAAARCRAAAPVPAPASSRRRKR